MATANPFSLPSIGADNPLAPEYLALERQKKIADLLMQKGQQLPEGQMVSGHYVAPSFTQQLNPLLNAYMGGNMAEQNEARTAKLADLLRGQSTQEIKNVLNAFESGDQSKALELSALGQTPFAQGIASELVKKRLIGKEPKWEKSEQFNEDGTITHGYVDVNAKNPVETFVKGSVKPAMTAYEKASIDRKEFEWNNLSAKDKAQLANDSARIGISAKELFFNTGMTSGGGGYAPSSTVQSSTPIQPQTQSQNQPTNQSQPLTKPQIAGLPTTQQLPNGQVLPPKMQLELMKEEQKGPTEFAGKAVLFGSAMQQSQNIISQLEKEGTIKGAIAPAFLSGIVKLAPLGVGDAAANAVEAAFRQDPTGFVGPDKNQQKLAQAQLAFASAWLRQTSGASFGATEIANTIKEFFPLQGESSGVIAQKTEARKRAIKGLEYLAGPSGAKQIQQYDQFTSKPKQRWNPQTQQLEDIK
jgi:hypothetical protein